jgi:SSS family transporter
MHPLDWLVVAAYFAFIVFVGFKTGRGHKGIEDYFLARRAMPWWVVGFSVMATQASAITVIGTPGQAYVDGMRFIQFYFGLPIALIIICATLAPFFYRARVYTAYEYLERRFDGRTRTLTSLFFQFARALADSVVIYAPAVPLSIVFGLDETLTIVLIGLGATVYTSLGGMRAVMWTEFWQMLVILLGILFCLGAVIAGLPDEVGLGGAIEIASVAGKTRTVDFNPDPRVTYTFWTGLLGGVFLMLSYFGCDQSQVQRYLTARSLRDGRVSLLFNALLKIPVQFIILLTGAMLFVFYHFEKPPPVFNRVELARLAEGPHRDSYLALAEEYDRAFEGRRAAALALTSSPASAKGASVDARSDLAVAQARFSDARRKVTELMSRANDGQPSDDTNYIFPTFVVTQLPPGVVGLILVAVLAAAMSTVESELNAISTASVVDIYRRYWVRSAPERHYLFAGRVATALWGGFATLCALYSGRLGSAIEAVNRIGSYFYGPILGVFLLAIAVPRANGRGAFYGLLVGFAAILWTSWNTSISFVYYNLVGCAVVLAAGYLLSLTVSEQRPAAGA